MRFPAVTLALALALPAGASPPVGLTVLGHIVDSASSGYLDGLFVHDNLAFYMRTNGGSNVLEIWDVSDPAAPALQSTTPLSGDRIADMHGIYYTNGILYCGIETPGGGFQVFDVSDPKLPKELVYQPVQGGVHNLRYADGYLYVMTNSNIDTDVWVYDVRVPAVPQLVGSFNHSGTSFCHDVSIMEGVGYASLWSDGLYILDLSDPTNIKVLNSALTGVNTHSAWPAADLKTVYTCHEAWDIGFHAWDVSVPAITELGTYQSHQTQIKTIIHDVMVVGNFAYLTYYKEGARVLDVSDPTKPTEVASYVMGNPADCPDGVGYCSAIAEWVEDGRYYLLDMDNGLWILSLDQPHDAPITVKAVKAGANQDVYLKWNHTGESQYTVRRTGLKQLVAGNPSVDVDARLSYVDKGAVAGNNLYFYRLNGPWQ